jgi:hypothetical protein
VNLAYKLQSCVACLPLLYPPYPYLQHLCIQCFRSLKSISVLVSELGEVTRAMKLYIITYKSLLTLSTNSSKVEASKATRTVNPFLTTTTHPYTHTLELSDLKAAAMTSSVVRLFIAVRLTEKRVTRIVTVQWLALSLYTHAVGSSHSEWALYRLFNLNL